MRYCSSSVSGDLKGVTLVQDFILKFQIDKYEVDDTDTANQVHHFRTYYCKGVEIMRILNFIEKLTKINLIISFSLLMYQ